MCKVSVIVPVYNGEKYLRACLESLAAQTLEDIEIIVVNDGSTDGSLAIAEEFTPPKFRVYSTENRGVSHARNYGAEKSEGEYLIFVDCDDDVTPEYCKVLYEKAVRDGNDLVVCKVEHIEYKGTGVKRTVSGTSLFDFDNYKLSEHPQILTELSTGPWNKLIARELFFRIQFAEDNCFAEDFLYSIQAFCLAKNIGTLAEPLYHYYHTHGGVTSRFSAVQLEWPKTMRNIFSFLRDNDLQGAYLAEVEIKLLEFCFSLNSRAVRMYNQDWRLRAEFIRVMYAFIHQEFPDWRKNCYYVERCKKVLLNKAASPRYDYGKRHLLFLIYLSRFFPDRCVPFILRVDRKLFVQVKYLRWKLHDWFRK